MTKKYYTFRDLSGNRVNVDSDEVFTTLICDGEFMIFGMTIDVLEQLRLQYICLLYTSPSPRDRTRSRMPSSA